MHIEWCVCMCVCDYFVHWARVIILFTKVRSERQCDGWHAEMGRVAINTGGGGV